MEPLNKLKAALVTIVVAGIPLTVAGVVHEAAHHGLESHHQRSIQAGGDDEWYD